MMHLHIKTLSGPRSNINNSGILVFALCGYGGRPKPIQLCTGCFSEVSGSRLGSESEGKCNRLRKRNGKHARLPFITTEFLIELLKK